MWNVVYWLTPAMSGGADLVADYIVGTKEKNAEFALKYGLDEKTPKYELGKTVPKKN
jgi:hypothetical protein